MDVGEYEKLMDRVELLQDVETAESQLDEGQGIAHAKVKKQLLARFRA